MDSKRPKFFPPVYFLSAIIAMVAMHHWIPAYRWLSAPYTYAGGLLIVAGLGLALSGNALFRRHETAIKPFEPSSTVVTGGVFRVSRNPMYLGMVLFLAGIAIIEGTAAPLGVIPVFVWWIQTRFIVKEEAMLEGQFGETYLAYKRRVRRWL